MLRLAHLSDIHITAPKFAWQARDWVNKRFAAWFNYRFLGRRHRFGHADEVLAQLVTEIRTRVDEVIFSGDATALGFESELARAVEALPLKSMPGFAVPGNHDYCTPFAALSGAFEKHFAPWLTGERLGTEIYPFARRMGDAWFIGVNSCTANFWAWDASGAVGGDQIGRLEKLLASLSPGPRILVTHYPVCLDDGKDEMPAHGLRDLEDVLRVARAGNIALWLHGHRHRNYYLEKPPQAPFPVICAGSATQTHLWSYNEYALDGRRFQCKRRVYHPERKQFEDFDEFELELPAAHRSC